MSIHRLTTLDVFCDRCHRSFGAAENEPAPGVGNWTSNVNQAREDMRAYGWTAIHENHRLIDLCPNCSAASLKKS